MNTVEQPILGYSGKIRDLLMAGHQELVTNKELGSWWRDTVHSVNIWSLGGDAGPPSGTGVQLVDLGGNGSVYIHLGLPYSTQDEFDCRLDIKGYQYGTGQPVDNRYLIGRRNGVVKSAVLGNNNPAVYADANGKLVCRLFLDNTYVLSFSVSVFDPSGDTRLEPGDIQGRVSRSAVINF